MASGWYIWRLRNSWLVVLVVVLSCTPSDSPKKNFSQYGLQNGDIVCRLGNGFFSKYFREFASKEQRYSHIGIIEVVGDSIFVLHTEASEFTGVGVAKREPLSEFLQEIKTSAFFRMKSTEIIRSRFVQKGKSYFIAKTPFDIDFDANNNEKLYCTELVAVALNYAVDSSLIKPQLQLGGRRFYGLDDIYQNAIFEKVVLKHTH